MAALRHQDVEARLGAIEELSKAFNDNLGYFAEAPPPSARRACAAGKRRWRRPAAAGSTCRAGRGGGVSYAAWRSAVSTYCTPCGVICRPERVWRA